MFTVKVKLKPNKKQQADLKQLSVSSMDLYNKLLQHNFDLLDNGEATLTPFGMNTLCRKTMTNNIGTDVINEICHKVFLALRGWQYSERIKLRMRLQHGSSYKKPLKAYLKAAGKRLSGKPRFKKGKLGKRFSIQFCIRKSGQMKIKTFEKQTSIFIPLVGRVKGYNDRQKIDRQVKFVIIKQDSCGDWWGNIVCLAKSQITITSRSEAIGVDLGLKHTVTAANELEIIQPERDRFLDKQLNNIKRASKNKKRDLPFIYRKILRKREQSHHTMAKRLIEAANTIYVGNLNSAWLFSGSLARSALDAAHGRFKYLLSRKAENVGKRVMIINEAFTSQTCYNCGSRKKMELSDRTYNCDTCDYIKDRDVNGALNIMKIGENFRLGASQPQSLKTSKITDSVAHCSNKDGVDT